jgi:hypothetical protein
MDLEDSEFSDECPEFVVQPYQFEPVADSINLRRDDSLSEDERGAHADHEEQDSLPTNTDW